MKPTRLDIVALFALVVLVNVVGINFVARENQLYTADHVAYWAMSSDLARAMSEDPWLAAVAVSDSIAQRQLNLFAATPIALSMLVFGDSRTCYVLTVINLYAIPSVLMLWIFVKRRENSVNPTLATCITMLVLPAFWFPISLGYLGVGGLVFCLGALTVYFDRSEAAQRPPALFSIGVLLAFAFIFRRWYAFWSTAFGLIVVAESAIGILRQPKTWRRHLSIPALVGSGAILTLLILALPRVATDLGTNYGDAFSGYKIHTDIFSELGGWTVHFGLLALVLTTILAIRLISPSHSRRIATLVSAQVVITFLLIRQVQDPSPQHFYLYFPGLMILLAMGVTSLRNLRFQRAIIVSVTLIGCVLTASVWLGPEGSFLRPLLPQIRIKPVDRQDMLEVRHLLDYLDDQLRIEPGYINIIGSTPTLSDTALAYANLSLEADFLSPPAILLSSHMDTRDGFPSNLLLANYIVVSDPLQCRSPAVGQRVVEVPGLAFLENRNIARAFERLPVSFKLEHNTRCYVFKKTRAIEDAELQAMIDALRDYYPDRPEIYLPGI